MPNSSTSVPAPLRLGLIGFGEVGKLFAEALVQQSDVAALAVWDRKLAAPETAEAERAYAQRLGVRACGSMAEVCAAAYADALQPQAIKKNSKT